VAFSSISRNYRQQLRARTAAPSVRLIDEKACSDMERWWYRLPSMRASWACSSGFMVRCLIGGLMPFSRNSSRKVSHRSRDWQRGYADRRHRAGQPAGRFSCRWATWTAMSVDNHPLRGINEERSLVTLPVDTRSNAILDLHVTTTRKHDS
jgi:hypothetical protein